MDHCENPKQTLATAVSRHQPMMRSCPNHSRQALTDSVDRDGTHQTLNTNPIETKEQEANPEWVHVSIVMRWAVR